MINELECVKVKYMKQLFNLLIIVNLPAAPASARRFDNDNNRRNCVFYNFIGIDDFIDTT